jgi:hypothetical protein
VARLTALRVAMNAYVSCGTIYAAFVRQFILIHKDQIYFNARQIACAAGSESSNSCVTDSSDLNVTLIFLDQSRIIREKSSCPATLRALASDFACRSDVNIGEQRNVVAG